MLNRSNYHLGRTTAERNAAFNSCSAVFIYRDGDCNRRGTPMRWFVSVGDPTSAIGFQAGEDSFPTMGEALHYAKAQFPSLIVWRRFLGRVDGRDDKRPLRLPSFTATSIPSASEGCYASDSQDVAATLDYVDKAVMRLLGWSAGDVQAVLSFPIEGDLVAVYGTDQTAFRNDSTWVRLL